jgi:DNA gyrase/topoisomerase IV subunit A
MNEVHYIAQSASEANDYMADGWTLVSVVHDRRAELMQGSQHDLPGTEHNNWTPSTLYNMVPVQVSTPLFLLSRPLNEELAEVRTLLGSRTQTERQAKEALEEHQAKNLEQANAIEALRRRLTENQERWTETYNELDSARNLAGDRANELQKIRDTLGNERVNEIVGDWRER